MAFAACVGLGPGCSTGCASTPARMLRNIDGHRGYLLSEPVMRALADRVGKHSAHEVVYAAAMTRHRPGQDFRAALRADPRLDAIPDAELDELLDVAGVARRVRRVRGPGPRRCAGAPG